MLLTTSLLFVRKVISPFTAALPFTGSVVWAAAGTSRAADRVSSGRSRDCVRMDDLLGAVKGETPRVGGSGVAGWGQPWSGLVRSTVAQRCSYLKLKFQDMEHLVG